MGNEEIWVMSKVDDLEGLMAGFNHYKFVYADRADLYYTEDLDKRLVQLSETVPVFIDLKTGSC